jgi:hypothetical protein
LPPRSLCPVAGPLEIFEVESIRFEIAQVAAHAGKFPVFLLGGMPSGRVSVITNVLSLPRSSI